ncbi:MAG: SDR family NAD(P)-dependent oxidoreductase [Clostridiales bacterium]|jgi:3-oxoacyl-[acyl-carrier protein] reductase|nr:SDR family NAD(P)-dependent oxidoreductase [Clostridiales bacterium]
MPLPVVLVTGSSRGIGLAVAGAFAASHRVALNCDKNIPQLSAAVDMIKIVRPDAIGVPADVSDYAQAERLYEAVRRRLGPVDVLVNNAGIQCWGLFQEQSPRDWRRVMDVNVNSAFNCAHLALPDMLRQKRGVIINISSVWGARGASCEAVYSASKGALDSFTRALAKELGPSGIRVNAIACGIIDTEMNAGLNREERETLRGQISLGRFGLAGEAGKIALYLASDDASYINGQIITADGGMY